MKSISLQSLHDAEIVRVDSAAAPERLEICVRDYEGTFIILAFEHCRGYRVNDFIGQNVISRVLVFDDAAGTDASIGEILEWLTSLTDSTSYLSDARCTELIRLVRAGDLRLFYFEPSWGAEIAILCEDFKMSVLSEAELSS